MAVYIVHAFLQRIGESLDHFRIFLQKAFLGTVRRVWHITGIHAAGSHHIAGSLLLQRSSGRLEFHAELSLSSGKGCRRGAKINASVNVHIFLRIQSVLFQNVFKYHFRHAACPAAQDIFSFQVTPLKVRHLLPGNHEVSCPLGQLGEIHYQIVRAFLVRVYSGFRAHKADICLSGEDCRHDFIRAETIDHFQPDPFLYEIAFFNRHILGRVKNRMGDFI